MAQDVVPDQRSDNPSDVSSKGSRMSANGVNPSLQNGNTNGASSRIGVPLVNPSPVQNSNGSPRSSTQSPDFSLHSTPVQSPSLQKASLLSGKWGVLIGLGIGLVLGVGVLPRLAGSDATQPNATPESSIEATAETGAGPAVTVATVESTQISRTLDATGTVVASDLLPILAKAPGLQIQQVLVDEGDRVTTGQPLVILDQSVIRTQITGAEANLEAAKARVIQREAALAQAKARLAEAQANLDRYQNLADQGAVSQQELDTRATTATTAQEEIRVAEANIRSAQADVLREDAQIQQLKTQLGQSVVTAPANGIVAERFARVGDVTSSSQALFSVIRDRLLELEVSVPETQLPAVQVGNAVAISSDADPQLRLQGRVQEIAPLIDPQTRQAMVKISLPDSLKLRPGMFLRAALTTDTLRGVTIPAAAVLPQANGSALVYRLGNDSQVQAQVVEIGELLDNGLTDFNSGSSTARIEILQGLQQGDRIVVEGAGYLKDGDQVNVVTN